MNCAQKAKLLLCTRTCTTTLIWIAGLCYLGLSGFAILYPVKECLHSKCNYKKSGLVIAFMVNATNGLLIIGICVSCWLAFFCDAERDTIAALYGPQYQTVHAGLQAPTLPAASLGAVQPADHILDLNDNV